MEQREIYDLLIIADATASMSAYLESLQTSLPQIISISALTGCFSRIGLLGYRDYGDHPLLEWSGWLDQSSAVEQEQPDLVALAKSMSAMGGGDYPEATKTALAKAHEVMSSEARTIILLYTDAPPHTAANGLREVYSNYRAENAALSDKNSYGDSGPNFVDWVSACKTFRSGEKVANVFCILHSSIGWSHAGYYNFLCTMTGGSCITLSDSKPATISKVTVELLLAWMGVETSGVSEISKRVEFPAVLSRYVDIANIKKIRHENDQLAGRFFATTSTALHSEKDVASNISSKTITQEDLKKYIPRKKTPIADFAKSWTTDSAYQAIAVKHLKMIFENDIRSMALNPVFGSLWRTVCNDRTQDARESLISAFGLGISRIADAEEKTQMKAWLEESYDYTAEVRGIIDGVSKDDQFPCVFLDPTLSFVPSGADLLEDESNRPINSFRRDELLEIGRSCDFKILRRLGRILTRLTYVESRASMPAHIAATTDEDIPKIPIALASKEYKNQFWRILLHTILPGTMLSGRPAALLAALSLRLGLEPLTQPAEQEMFRWRSKWNNADVPETWNVSCLSLLLDADKVYGQRQQDLNASAHSEGAPQNLQSLLTDGDRALFEHLVALKMLELNLDTTLIAQVGWTPEKSVISIGPVVICRACQYPRSVTVMGRSGKCGSCLYTTYDTSEVREKCISTRVAKDHNEQTPASWVECSVRTCRAQYVVYNIEDLRVRPKCHYCRSQIALPVLNRSRDPAPWVECTRCLNRMIWPEQYRPSSFSRSGFLCPPCTSGHKSISEVEVTAKNISIENGTSWLIKDSNASAENPFIFANRSIYQMISTLGTNNILRRITIFPPTKFPLALRGKVIRNPESLISTLRDQISRRQTERIPCSLCFSDFQPSALNPACGRRGCHQRICRACLSGWYGLNSAGRMINTASLSCPFCRRLPGARTLSKYGMGIHAVGQVAMAVQEKGHWIYAWCQACDFAKRLMERVCARGTPVEVNGWTCDQCREEKEEREQRRLAAERELAERAIRDAQIARDARAAEIAETRRVALALAMEESRRVTKLCPGCGVATEKLSGCNHITCPVRGCHSHWCFVCVKVIEPNLIYAHLKKAHGGIFGEDDV